MSPFSDPSHSSQKSYLPEPPNDTISRLRFSPPATSPSYLIASSWNGSIRCWKVQEAPHLHATAVTMVEQPAPLLDCCWANNGSAVYLGGANKLVHRWDLASGAMTPVAGHDDAVRCISDVEENGMLVTASWDKTLRYWDVRAPTGSPVGTVPVSDRVYAMDVAGPLMVVGMADRKVSVFDVRKPATAFRDKFSQLWYQTRCVATWPDRMGYCVGGVDGRVSIDFVREGGGGGSMVCHKDKGKGYAVNAIRFHKETGSFMTAGSDGKVAVWDKERKRERGTWRRDKERGPVTDLDIDATGRVFAYAVGYDWSSGAAGRDPTNENTYIVLDRLEEGDLDPRANGHEGGGRGRGRGGKRRGGNSRR